MMNMLACVIQHSLQGAVHGKAFGRPLAVLWQTASVQAVQVIPRHAPACGVVLPLPLEPQTLLLEPEVQFAGVRFKEGR